MSKWILGRYGISSSAEKAFHFRNTFLVLIKFGHKFRRVLYLRIWIFPLPELNSWTFRKKIQSPHTAIATNWNWCCKTGKVCLLAGCPYACWAVPASGSWRGFWGKFTWPARHAGLRGAVWEAAGMSEKGWDETMSSGGWRGASKHTGLSPLSLPTNPVKTTDH